MPPYHTRLFAYHIWALAGVAGYDCGPRFITNHRLSCIMAYKGRQARYYQRSALFQLAVITTLAGVSGAITLTNTFLFATLPLSALLAIPVSVLTAFLGVWMMVHTIDGFHGSRRSRRGGQPRANPLWALFGWALALVGPPALVYFTVIV